MMSEMTHPTDDELEAEAVRFDSQCNCNIDTSPCGAEDDCRENQKTAAMLRACKGRDTAAFETGLNTALKIIASLGYGKNQDVDEGHEEAYRAVETYFADWKANKPSEPLSLAALNELTPEQKEANRNAAFAERGWIPALDHAEWNAAIEAAANVAREMANSEANMSPTWRAGCSDCHDALSQLKKGQTND